MTRLTLLVAVAVITAATGAATGQDPGTTMRYHLDEGQVLVYKATGETRFEDKASHRDQITGRRVRSKTNTETEVVFSFTAGKQDENGTTPITIEVLDISYRDTEETSYSDETVEANAEGIKVYRGKKLVTNAKWGDPQVPAGRDLRAALAARIEGAFDEHGQLAIHRWSDEVRLPLQAAHFHLLVWRQPVFPDRPIVKGESWTVNQPGIPASLQLPVPQGGVVTYTAVEAVRHLNRNCLKLSVQETSPKANIPTSSDTYEATGSGTAIVDFATAVLLSYTAKVSQEYESGGGGGFQIDRTSTVTYIGGKQLYDKYKAGRTTIEEPQGVTMRYHLDEGQVLVYGAVADIKVEGRGEGGGRRGRDDRSGESETHIEMVFSLTAGELLANGGLALTIEILDVKITQTRDLERGRRRIEMDASGVRVYDGKTLEQQSAWGEIQLPSGLNIRRLLETPIEAAVNELGMIGKFRDADEVKELLRGANFLHLLRRQPVFPEAAIRKGSTWTVDSELAMSNPLRLRELYRLPGTETYTAEAAVTHMNRPCLRLSIKGDWPRKELAGGGEAKASGSATAIVDFATGVMFAYSSKTKQTLEGTAGGADVDFEIESTATITYLGDRATYDKYKAGTAQHD